jgi:hypothetical protein
LSSILNEQPSGNSYKAEYTFLSRLKFVPKTNRAWN